MQKPRIAVIGGGIGGLVAAAELAAHGAEVTLFEQHEVVGGKIRRARVDGRTIDVGPTVLTMRWVFERIFEDLGTRLDEHVQLDDAEVLARHAWPDGSRLDLFADDERTAEAIRDLAGADEAVGFLRFRKHAAKLYDASCASFMLSASPRVRDMARSAGPAALLTLPRIDPLRSMWRSIKRFFSDDRLRRLFARYATYYGSSPFLAPAVLNLIAHVELSGVWLPRGGMYALVNALARQCERAGVDIRTSKPVRTLQAHEKRTSAVILDSGEHFAVDGVVFNGDVGALRVGLLGEEVARELSGSPRLESSLSALTVALVAETTGFELASHNVFFSGAPYRDEFETIFRRAALPSQPTVYVRAQDRDDTQNPRPGRERLFFIINAPVHQDSAAIGSQEVDECVRSSFRVLDRCGLKINATTASMQTHTPLQLANAFPGSGGAVYGAATHSLWAPMRRPGPRSTVRGLYLAGGSIHPGAGVPMAALSGRRAAQTLLQDLGLTSLCPIRATPGGTSTR